MSQYRELQLGETRDFKFCTVQVSGAPFTLAGTPAISAYIGNSTTQITAGITLSVDFDSVTGLNNVRVVATSGNGYTAGTDVDLVITTGTVNSVSVVGYVIASFRIIGIVSDPRYGITAAGTFSGTHSTTTADLGTSAPSVDISGQTLGFTSTGLTRLVDSYNTGTGVATFSPALAGAPTDGQGWVLYASSPASTGSLPSVLLSPGTGAGQIALTSGAVTVGTNNDKTGYALSGTQTFNTTGNITGNLSGSVGSVTGAVGSVTGAVGSVTGSVGSVTGAVGSVTGAVGSVTGNVGGNVNGSVASVTTVNDKTGYRLGATGVDDIWDEVIEGTTTGRQGFRGIMSALFAKLSGAATATVTVRDIGDTKARITATVDSDGNRTAITTDLT